MKILNFKLKISSMGFTLIELLVVIALLGILITGLLSFINPVEQFKKTRDTQRKQDLSQIQKVLESYHIDKGTYPQSIPFGNQWIEGETEYMTKVPQEPLGSPEYIYRQEDSGVGYRLFAKLERCSDSQIIANIDCKTEQYNYSVTSPNLSVVALFSGVEPTVAQPVPTVGGGGATSTPAPTVTAIAATPNPPGIFTFTGNVFLDNNSNDVKDAEEQCYSGSVTISISASGTTPVTFNQDAACNNKYRLDNFLAGTYTLTMTPITGYLSTKATPWQQTVTVP